MCKLMGNLFAGGPILFSIILNFTIYDSFSFVEWMNVPGSNCLRPTVFQLKNVRILQLNHFIVLCKFIAAIVKTKGIKGCTNGHVVEKTKDQSMLFILELIIICCIWNSSSFFLFNNFVCRFPWFSTFFFLLQFLHFTRI